MTYDELIEIIRNRPFRDGHWLYDDDNGIFTLKDDLNIRIERKDDELEIKFEAPWTEIHSDKRAFRYFLHIYYGASFVEDFILVSVDGVRAYLPLPKIPGSVEVTQKKYDLARAVDHQGTLDEYLGRSKLTVVPD